MTAKARRLSKKSIEEIVAQIPRRMAERKKDEDDRRCRRGKYAPEVGVCRVCAGPVRGVVRFRDTGRIGGPPPSSYVAHWACEDCGLMYAKAPPPAAPVGE